MGTTDPPPKIYYSDSRESVLYRLSELMFGSLLASYVLGFIAFASNLINQIHFNVFVDPTSSWVAELISGGVLLLPVLTYLVISASYSYLTAGFYISYHTDILTMPALPQGRIKLDFRFALLQGVFFGISMIAPPLFPLIISITIWLGILRKWIEYRSLKGTLIQNLPHEGIPPNNHEVANRKVERVLRTMIGKDENLWVWLPFNLVSILLNVGFTILSIALMFFESFNIRRDSLALFCVCFTIFLILYIQIHYRILNKKPQLVSTPQALASFYKSYGSLEATLKIEWLKIKNTYSR